MCPATWNGQQCEVYDPRFPGGVGRKTQWVPTISDDLQLEKIKCAEKRCHEKSGNGICDEDCNTLGTCRLNLCKFPEMIGSLFNDCSTQDAISTAVIVRWE